MKKTWQEPTLEVLDINMTMWNLKGEHPDGSWIDHIENIVDGTMNSMS
jgi:hypothetical protein